MNSMRATSRSPKRRRPDRFLSIFIEQFGPLVVTQRVSRYPVAAATSEMLSGITRKRYDLERAPSQAGELWQNKARRS